MCKKELPLLLHEVVTGEEAKRIDEIPPGDEALSDRDLEVLRRGDQIGFVSDVRGEFLIAEEAEPLDVLRLLPLVVTHPLVELEDVVEAVGPPVVGEHREDAIGEDVHMEGGDRAIDLDELLFHLVGEETDGLPLCAVLEEGMAEIMADVLLGEDLVAVRGPIEESVVGDDAEACPILEGEPKDPTDLPFLLGVGVEDEGRGVEFAGLVVEDLEEVPHFDLLDGLFDPSAKVMRTPSTKLEIGIPIYRERVIRFGAICRAVFSFIPEK